jgi:hypothetical protein
MRLCAFALLVMALSQMVAGLAGWEPLREAVAGTGAAPYPKVFCDKDGYEAFAMDFEVAGIDTKGCEHRVAITPETYARMRGPYNRRNVYGAALAFAPRLDAELRDEVVDYAFRRDGGLRRELGLPDDLKRLHIRITPKPGVKADSYEYTYDLGEPDAQ